jgi:Tol biopolymer transport system component
MKKLALPFTVGALLLAVAPAARATFPGDNGLIAYRADHGSDTSYRIYTRAPFGGAEMALTTDGTAAGPTPYNTAGRRLVYYFGGDIWIMRYDGNLKRKITDSPLEEEVSPIVGPTGKWVAWFQGESPAKLHVMRTDGTDERVVANVPGEGGEMSWSPDGKTIAAEGYRNANLDLLLIDVSSGDKQWITNTGRSESGVDWSPDGSLLVFAMGPTTSTKDLYTIEPDGTGRKQLTFTTKKDEGQPCWSPNGRKLLFVQRIIATNSRDLAIMRAGGGKQHLVGAIAGDDFDPAWQPDFEV